MSRIAQRIVGIVVLVGVAVFTLPVTATFLDDPGSENWILPVQMAAMAVLGGVCGLALPAMASPGASRSVRALVGAGWGLLAAVVALLVFWFVLSGLGGA